MMEMMGDIGLKNNTCKRRLRVVRVASSMLCSVYNIMFQHDMSLQAFHESGASFLSKCRLSAGRFCGFYGDLVYRLPRCPLCRSGEKAQFAGARVKAQQVQLIRLETNV